MRNREIEGKGRAQPKQKQFGYWLGTWFKFGSLHGLKRIIVTGLPKNILFELKIQEIPGIGGIQYAKLC